MGWEYDLSIYTATALVLVWLWRKEALSSHWRQAVYIGVLALGVSLVIYWLLWMLWYERSSDHDDGYQALKLGFGQTVASFLTIFLAGALGLYAIREFSERHEKTFLEVSIPNAHRYVEGIPQIWPLSEHPVFPFTVRVKNAGDISVSSFVVKLNTTFVAEAWKYLHFPRLPERAALSYLYNNMTLYEGDLEENWSIRLDARLTYEGDHFRSERWMTLIFRSNNNLVLLPGETINLVVLNIPKEAVKLGQTYTIEYQANGVNCRPNEDTLDVQFIDVMEGKG